MEEIKDMNELAVALTVLDEGKKEVSIADVKEMLSDLKQIVKAQPKVKEILTEYWND